MSKLQRFYRPGQICFVTVVTHRRRPILVENADLLRYAVDGVADKFLFNMLAWVILPDHLHAILDPGNNDLSKITRRVKLSFANYYLHRIGARRGRVWQPRFWDHIIRDQEDMNRHIDYIHFNPVKHGVANDPFVWEYSSLSRFFEKGHYERNWGVAGEIESEGDFGE